MIAQDEGGEGGRGVGGGGVDGSNALTGTIVMGKGGGDEMTGVPTPAADTDAF